MDYYFESPSESISQMLFRVTRTSSNSFYSTSLWIQREVVRWHVASVHINISAKSVNLQNLTAINVKQGISLVEAENKIGDWR